jgi:ubiquitin C-terminal hydrolase
MNATIQCLSNVKRLSDELLKNYGKYDIKSQPLTLAYSSLIFDLFNNNQKYIAPNIFKKIIGVLNPLFEGNHAADAKDLLFFLIEELHKELNQA